MFEYTVAASSRPVPARSPRNHRSVYSRPAGVIYRRDGQKRRMGDPMPDIQPMLATTGELPDDTARWALEVKWDGVRAIVHVAGGRVRVVGRRGNDATSRYPELQTLADLL